MNDTDFDRQFGALAEVEPPELLVARTVATYKRERTRGAWIVRVAAVGGMALMAALSLMVVSAPPERGSAETMVERGTSPVRADVELKVAVRHGGGSVERFAANQRYAAGDTLMFRVTTPSSTPLRLLREGVLLWAGTAPAGESDLPVGYTLEAGETAARFVVEGGAESQTLYVPAVAP